MTSPILALEDRRCAALLSADVAELTRLFADDLLWIHGSGKSDGKTGMLDNIGSGRTKYLRIESSQRKVRFFGDIAFVDGAVAMELNLAGEIKQVNSRFTICWARTADDWQIIHWQSTPLRPTA
ncbi:MAG TPA: nuclear transport factor 2 family protein [Duganella sp.]|uniref:nuclear transport factor 2 family protein n=1 Tax=Duganella sp. TaxID=1904440 RepID=UPI002ED028FC